MRSRKVAVVAAVRDNRITMADALHRYQLTEEEFPVVAARVRAPRSCRLAGNPHSAIS